jgi:hypothetical protein
MPEHHLDRTPHLFASRHSQDGRSK